MSSALPSPPARLPRDRLRDLATAVESDPRVRFLLDLVPAPLVLLSRSRQVLHANGMALELLGETGIQRLRGRRPGEALACQEAKRGPDGCGTAPACRFCGGARTLAEALLQDGGSVTGEWRVIADREGLQALDLEIRVSCLHMEDDAVLLAFLRDIGDEKRRAVLERVFFHDALNLMGGVQGMTHALRPDFHVTEAERAELTSELQFAVSRLTEEIRNQRRLLAAERGELALELESLDAARVLQEVKTLYARHPVAEGRTIRVDAPDGLKFVSDRALLVRSLGNLVKNALEAIPDGETVTIWAEEDADGVRFTVANAGEIPEDVRLRIFQRSFTTKEGRGRGIGTWSVRLFAESYLGGTVGLESDAEAGTRFRIRLPRTPPSGSGLPGPAA